MSAQAKESGRQNPAVSSVKALDRRQVNWPGTEQLAADEMRVVACGTGIANSRLWQAAACFLFDNGDKFIFDIGSRLPEPGSVDVMEHRSCDLTQILVDASGERPEDVAKKLMPLVYDELRSLAAQYLRSERPGHTLQPTALVHEAFMRLVDHNRVDWKGRTHFYAVGAEAMRRILIDHARARGRGKRGGEWQRVLLDEADTPQDLRDLDVIALHDALQALSALDEEQARIVELRFFGGLTVEEVAHVLGVSKRKVEGDWTHAKAWLRSELDPDTQS